MDGSINISCYHIAAIFKRILSSDWLPKRVKWAHHARSGLHGLIPRKKENCLGRTYKRVRKLWTVSATESQKAVEGSQSKENSRGFIGLQKQLALYPVSSN